MTSGPQPGWYADPAGAAHLRWWDGGRWTDRIVRDGVQTASPLPRGRVQGTASLFAEPVLLVQPGEADVVRTEDGRQVAVVQPVAGGGWARVPGLSRWGRHRLEVRDAEGAVQLLLTRARGEVVVERPGTGEAGRLVRDHAAAHLRYALASGGREVGSLGSAGAADEAAVLDAAGAEVACRTGSRVRITWPLPDPLGPLVVAAVLLAPVLLAPSQLGPSQSGPERPQG